MKKKKESTIKKQPHTIQTSVCQDRGILWKKLSEAQGGERFQRGIEPT